MTPIIDYASPIWASAATQDTLEKLGKVQRIGAQAITGAFNTVSLLIAESEASLLPCLARLRHQELTTWIKWHTKPLTHRFWKVKRSINLSNKTWVSLLQKIATRFKSLDLTHLEIIEAFAKPPGVPSVTVTIPEKAVAIKSASLHPNSLLTGFTDGSSRNYLVGIGVYWQGSVYQWPTISRTISAPYQINTFAGELAAIEAATSFLLSQLQGGRKELLHSIIFSDSQEALKALKTPAQQSGQFFIRNITSQAATINKSRFASVRYQWCPGHSKVLGNEKAHTLSRKATEPGNVIQSTSAPKVLLLASALSIAKQKFSYQNIGDFYKAKVGRFTKTFDKALPGPHTRLLYNRKQKTHASILCQLRSGINRLNKYLARIKAVQSSQCKCGKGEESVDHFLFRCPQWSIYRGEIRRLAGRRWGDTSFMLGGWSGVKKDGEVVKWKPANEMVIATINFAIATGRIEDKRKGREKSSSEQSESE